MAHIHTNKGEHDHTASAYIVRTDEVFDEPKIMLHRHRKLGVYLQFGGHIELNENPWQAMAHELAEESGYDISTMQVMQPKQRMKALDHATMHPIPLNHNTHNFDPNGDHKHIDLGYLMIASYEPTLEIEDGESTDIQLFTLAELNALDAPSEIYENVRQISRFCLQLVIDDSGWEPVHASEFSLLLEA